MLDLALFPLSDPVMQMAFGVAILLCVPTALLSCILVLRGWALMGDALSHAVLPGIVLSFVLGIPFLVGAILAALLCVFSTRFITAHSQLKPDTVLGVVFSGMFGAGLVLHAAIPSDMHLDHILFGDLLGVNGHDLLLAAIAAVSVLTFMILRYRDLMIVIFDEVQARVLGLPLGLMNFVLLVLLAFSIVTTLQSSGLILAIAMVITPGACAFLLTNQFRHMLWISTALAVVSSFCGLYFSFWLDAAPAPTITLCLTACFILSFSIDKLRKPPQARSKL